MSADPKEPATDPYASLAESFLPSAISADTAAWNRMAEELLSKVPPAHTLPPQVTRDAREAGRGPFGPIVLSKMAVERTIPGPSGPLGLRMFLPKTVRGIYLHIHGGGWVFGRAHHSDVQNEALATSCELAVVSVDYRLAPENPYPAAPDDCEAAALWLARNALAEFGTERIVIGGESAGAHLSALTLLRLRDRHGFTGFAAANFVYGAFDLSMTPSAARWGDRYLVLSTPLIHWFLDCFVGKDLKDRRRDPDVSPLYADLSGLPPALFTIGTMDPLLDDSLFMYSRYLAAGNRAELAVYPGGVHGFNLFPMELARRANERIASFLRSSLYASRLSL
jgi:acetyl esterase/lipase